MARAYRKGSGDYEMVKHAKRSITIATTPVAYRDYLDAAHIISLPILPAVIIEPTGIVRPEYDLRGGGMRFTGGSEDFNNGTIGILLTQVFETFPDPQIEALVWQCSKIFKALGINPAVWPKDWWGKYEPKHAETFRGALPISAITRYRHDPGPNFPYDKFAAAIAEVQ